MPSTRKRSGDPRKQVSSAKAWKAKSARMELSLPSGEVCLVKRPGLPQLIAANVLPDMLSGIAQNAVAIGENGGKLPVETTEKMMQDAMAEKDGLQNILDSFARVTAFCVIEPTCHYHRRKVETVRMDGIDAEWEDIPEDERDEDVLYTDEVDMNDQMFIFNFVVGGTADLVEFRRELGESMGRMAVEPDAQENAS